MTSRATGSTLTLVAPTPDFLYKPLLVEEPFALGRRSGTSSSRWWTSTGPASCSSALVAVRPEASHRRARRRLDARIRLPGRLHRGPVGRRSRGRPPSRRATEPFGADEVLDRAGKGTARIAFVVPPGVTWSLPLYELALMTARRAVERAHDVGSPSSRPSGAAGHLRPGRERGGRRAARGPWHRGRRRTLAPVSGEDGELHPDPGDRALGPGRGGRPAGDGGPGDRRAARGRAGLHPDRRARAGHGVEDVYAAGDGTNFPIKQGGLGTQQADAAAEHIAAPARRRGRAASRSSRCCAASSSPASESLHLRADVAGGGGEGEASPDYLWWPPHKISGRYLAPLLYDGDVHARARAAAALPRRGGRPAQGVARGADGARPQRHPPDVD